MKKIGIIGVGHVGSHVAYSILHRGLCSDLVLIDKNESLVKAHAFDLVDGVSYFPCNTNIVYNDYSALDDADLIVISVAGKIVAHERLKELDTSIECVDDVLENLSKTKFKGIILSITNPCDIVAYYIKKKTGLNVIGSGTTLDSSRLKVAIARRLNVSPVSVNGFILGEHGDSQFPCYSNLTIGGIPLKDYAPNFPYEEVTNEVRFRATPIFGGKGNTEFAIGVCTSKIISAIFNDTKEILPLSSAMDEYGFSELFMSCPCIVGSGGVIKKVKLNLTDKESELLIQSSKIIKANIARIHK